MAYQNAGVERKSLPGEAPTAFYAPSRRRVPASRAGFSRIKWNGGRVPPCRTNPARSWAGRRWRA